MTFLPVITQQLVPENRESERILRPRTRRRRRACNGLPTAHRKPTARPGPKKHKQLQRSDNLSHRRRGDGTWASRLAVQMDGDVFGSRSRVTDQGNQDLTIILCLAADIIRLARGWAARQDKESPGSCGNPTSYVGKKYSLNGGKGAIQFFSLG